MNIEKVINALIIKNEFDKAKDFLELARSVAPQDTHLKKQLAVILIHQGDIEAAKALLNEVATAGKYEPENESPGYETNSSDVSLEEPPPEPTAEKFDFEREEYAPLHGQQDPSTLAHTLSEEDDLETAFDQYWVPDIERREKRTPRPGINQDFFDSKHAIKATDRREEIISKATLWATRLSIEFELNPTDRGHLERSIEVVPTPSFLESLGKLLDEEFRAAEIYLAARFIAYWRANIHLSDSSLESESHLIMPEMREVLEFVRSYRSTPQAEEMLRFIELAHGEWSTNMIIRRRYPVFFDCLMECGRQADSSPLSPDALS